MLKKIFISAGEYVLFMKQVFKKPEKWRIFWRQTLIEADKLVLGSVLLVGVIALFIGGVLVIQTASNLQNPMIDKMYIGYMVRESLILEFCSTMIAAILAGKMGSNISSEIGSMRITEQIDAMEMMGVNLAGFLVLPKVVATTVLGPLLVFFSLFLGLVGGWLVVASTQIIPVTSYITGIKAFYNGYFVFYSCFKMSLFCFMISSIAAFNGYYAKGGSLGVGRSSTKAIVVTSILILLADLIVTQLMLY